MVSYASFALLISMRITLNFILSVLSKASIKNPLSSTIPTVLTSSLILAIYIGTIINAAISTGPNIDMIIKLFF